MSLGAPDRARGLASAPAAPSVSVVVMAYNEAASLRAVVDELRGEAVRAGWQPDVIVVDDGSTDGTSEIAADLRETDGVSVIHHGVNRGIGEVYRSGFRAATGEYVTILPADGQFPASVVTQLAREMHDADLVLGYLPDQGSRRSPLGKLLSMLEHAAFRALFGRLPKFQGVLMFRRSILDGLPLRTTGRGWVILTELILRARERGWRIRSVQTPLRDRMAGASKVNNVRTIVANVRQALRLRRDLHLVDADPGDRLRPRTGTTRAEAWALVASLVVALAIYQPWEALPFSSTDFSEFLPLLRGHAGFVDRLQAFVRHYAAEGRFNVLQYAGLALKWSLFGASPVAWQLFRAAQMAVIVVAVFVLLRRLGASSQASLAGASLYLCSSAAANAWTRLTMGEPLGLLILLAATFVAADYQRGTRWRRRAAAIAALVAAALLTKEMLVAFVPFLLLVAWCHEGQGRWRRPSVRRRDVELLAVTALAVAVVAVPVALAVAHARVGSFAAGYGGRPVTAETLVALTEHMALPESPSADSAWRALPHPANLLFLLTLGTGLALVPRRRGRSTTPLLLTCGSLPVAAAALYSPWPGILSFYALPFLLGSALLLAEAVDALRAHGPRWTTLAYAASLVGFAFSCLTAYQTARLAAARRDVSAQVALAIGALPDTSSVVVAARPVSLLPPAAQWMGAGPTLSRYASAITGRRAPLAVNVPCDEAARLQARGAVVLWMTDECGSAPRPTRTFRRYFRYVDWLSLRLVRDSLRMDLVEGPDGR